MKEDPTTHYLSMVGPLYADTLGEANLKSRLPGKKKKILGSVGRKKIVYVFRYNPQLGRVHYVFLFFFNVKITLTLP